MQTFQQSVFAKRRNGDEHRGVIVRARFYPILGVTLGEPVTLRFSGSALQANAGGSWQTLSFSFEV